jgi:hypothetical protein
MLAYWTNVHFEKAYDRYSNEINKALAIAWILFECLKKTYTLAFISKINIYLKNNNQNYDYK